MNEQEKLLQWMVANDLTLRKLADAMGFSYDGVYQAIKVRKYFSPEFKWRFQEAFGPDETASVFGEQPIETAIQVA